MKYLLNFVCEKDGDSHEQTFDVEFPYNENQYGNGTYMWCKAHDKVESHNYHFDIRYDHSYHADQQIKYIMEWVLDNWSGKNGSWKTTSISVKEIKE